MLGDRHVDDPSPLMRDVIVGTTKRSAAMIWLAWFFRKVRHVCDGGRGCRRMYLATVDSLTEIPSF